MRTAFCLAVVLVATSAHAELLIEWTQTGRPGGGLTQPVGMTYSVGFGNDLVIHRLEGSFDENSIREFSPAQVASIDDILKSEDGAWGSSIGVANVGGYANNLWTQENALTTFTRHVPRLGVGLNGYHLTRITETLDYENWEMQCGHNCLWYGEAQHTIRIFGDVIIPEPASIALVLATLFLSLTMRGYRP